MIRGATHASLWLTRQRRPGGVLRPTPATHRTGQVVSDVEHFIALGHQAIADSAFDEAVRHYDSAIRVESRNPGLHALRGRTLVYLRRWKQARRALNRSLKLDPTGAWIEGGRPGIVRDRGTAEFHLRRYERACRDLSEAKVDQRQDDWSLRYVLGNALLLVGRDAEALAEFEAARAHDPSMYQAPIQMAYLLSCSPDPRVRDGQRARELALDVTGSQDGEDWATLTILAAAHAECGDFEEATRVAERVVELAPERRRKDRIHRLQQYQRGEASRIDARARRKSYDPNAQG